MRGSMASAATKQVGAGNEGRLSTTKTFKDAVCGKSPESSFGRIFVLPIQMDRRKPELVDGDPVVVIYDKDLRCAAEFHNLMLVARFGPVKPSLEEFKEFVGSWGLLHSAAVSELSRSFKFSNK